MKSPLRYVGGKSAVADNIARMLPPMREYREPFCGGASVFYRAKTTAMAQVYWLNDLDQALMNFWKVVQLPASRQVLIEEALRLHYQIEQDDIDPREYFQHARQHMWSNHSNVLRALYFYFINRSSFSGAGMKAGFSMAAASQRFTRSRILDIERSSRALEDVALTCADAADLIRLPGKDVFLFLDPPYYQPSGLYVHDDIDHEALAKLLRKTDHKFLLTYDDCAEIRNLYSWANIKAWSKKYGMTNVGGVATKDGAELFISNYEVTTR